MNGNQTELVLEWFTELEQQLHRFLRTVNYNDQNRDSVFPILANIIVDAGSILDTVFREEYSADTPQKSALTIKQFLPHYESRLSLSKGRVLIYQFPPQYLEPFAAWSTNCQHNLTWWNAHNELKHNRIS